MSAILRLSLLLSLILLLPLGAATPRNVIWIISDDLGLELGCYGYPQVRTPNLDRLAAEGTRFTNAYSTSPVCSSSRSAFTTGCYQTTTGTHMHDMVVARPLPKPYRPCGHHFREAGFFTANQNGDPAKTGKAKVHYNFTEPEHYPFFMGADWDDRTHKTQRFFANVQISQPHRAFKTVLPDHLDPEKMEVPPIYPDHPATRADWALYLAHIETLDRHVGSVLDRLEEGGIAGETAVIFFGDHGRPHLWDKQWLTEGGLRVPLIIRWPDAFQPGSTDDRLVSLIDMLPTSLALAGAPVDAHIQGRNLLDTDTPPRTHLFAARDRCGDAPDRIRSVRGERYKLVRNFHPELPYMNHSGYKKGAYPAWTVMEALHAEEKLPEHLRFRMAADRPEFELYDLEEDPDELRNLAADPEHADTLAHLTARLDDWMEETGDRGGEEEMDAATWAGHQALKRKRLDKLLQSRGLEPDVSPADYLGWWEGELGLR